jgi:hypothetical protein
MTKQTWRKNYDDQNPKKRILWSAKKRAKNKGLKFSLTEDDINLPDTCPYLGLKLVSSSVRGTSRNAVYSLDRIDNTLGYIPENVEVISHLANTMKNGSTREQLLRFAEEVLKRYGTNS